jgi:hypothetical protein
LGLVVGFAPGSARAQFGLIGGTTPPGSTPAAGSAGGGGIQGSTLSNFLMNPYMNPLINPYAGSTTASTITPGDMALYMFAAQSMYNNGGIGSGRISGTRPGPVADADKDKASKKTKNTANTPGGTAARYFSRAYAGPPRHETPYSRQSKYFPQTGK